MMPTRHGRNNKSHQVVSFSRGTGWRPRSRYWSSDRAEKETQNPKQKPNKRRRSCTEGYQQSSGTRHSAQNGCLEGGWNTVWGLFLYRVKAETATIFKGEGKRVTWREIEVLWLGRGRGRKRWISKLCSWCRQQNIIRSACINDKVGAGRSWGCKVSGKRDTGDGWREWSSSANRLKKNQGLKMLHRWKAKMRKHSRAAHKTPQKLRLRTNRTGMGYC